MGFSMRTLLEAPRHSSQPSRAGGSGSAAEAAADLGDGQAEQRRAAVRRGGLEVDAVEGAQERLDLAGGEAVAGTHDGVAGDLGERAEDAVLVGGGAVGGPLVEEAAEDERRVGLEAGGDGLDGDRGLAERLGL